MEVLKSNRDRFLAALTASSLMIAACWDGGKAKGIPEEKAPHPYNLQYEVIGDVRFLMDGVNERGRVLDFQYEKDGVRTICTVYHIKGRDEAGAGLACRYEPVAE